MTEDAVRELSWNGYRALIGAFLAAGYQVMLFDELSPDQPHLVLRHDIDFSPKAAVDMARIEAELGVRSQYYVLLRTEFYNLCSPLDWDHVGKLIDLGHEVGLHFDASRYDQDLAVLEEAAGRECEILEKITGREVRSISLHRPAQALLGLERKLAGRSHVYQPKFFSDIAYVADSRGLFRFGHPLDHPAFAERKAMQLLTHPIWWSETDTPNKMTLVDRLLDERFGVLIAEAIANCEPYAEYRAAADRR